MNNYRDLFGKLSDDVESSKQHPYSKVDWEWYRRIAEQISSNAKSSAVLIAIFIAAFFVCVTFFEELRINNRNHIIRQQHELLFVQGMQDSIIFNCVHCGWKHTLQIETNSTQQKNEISPN